MTTGVAAVEAPTTSRTAVAPRTPMVVAGVVALGVLRYALVANPLHYLWWEDGVIWLPEARRGFTLDPYAGYVHVIPRLVGAVVAAFPLAWAPGVYLALFCAAAALCVAVVWLASAEVIASTGWRLVATGVFTALPLAGSGEPTMTTTHIQWWLIPAACWAVLLPPQRRRLAITAGLLAGLSAALLPVALAPVALAARRWRHPAVLASMVWVVQLPVLLASDRHPMPDGLSIADYTLEHFGGGLLARDGVPALVGLGVLVGCVLVARRSTLGLGFAAAGLLLHTVGSVLNGAPGARYSIAGLVLLVAGVAVSAAELPRFLPAALGAVWLLSLPATIYADTPPMTWQEAVKAAPCVNGAQVIEIGPWPRPGPLAQLDC